MSTRTNITLLISMMVSAVLFGIGVTTVLSVPSLSGNAMVLIPLVIVASFALTPILSWIIAPTMQARYSRRVDAERRLGALNRTSS